MSFSFDFSDDDIDVFDDRDLSHAASEKLVIEPKDSAGPCTKVQQKQEIPVVKHDLQQLLDSLPDRISYFTTVVAAPQSDRRLLIPRRAFFDVRLQTIAESSADDEGRVGLQEEIDDGKVSSEEVFRPFIGFGDSDIEKDIYEGGFKTWEGAVDLAALLMNHDKAHWSSFSSIVELGCGTGLPSLVLFAWEMSSQINDRLESKFGRSFILADYNHDTLRLMTVPNLLLVWALNHAQDAFDPRPPSLSSHTSYGGAANSLRGTAALSDAEGDLVITPELLAAFTTFISTARISINLISGPWVPRQSPSPQENKGATHTFVECLDISRSNTTLVLAAETVYSPDSIAAFCVALLSILEGSGGGSMGLVAAKQVYFGVGGGVAEFKRSIMDAARVNNTRNLIVKDVEGMNSVLDGTTHGVGRWLGEVFLA